MPDQPRHPAPAPPYAGPPYRSSAGNNKPIDRVVIHSTVSSSRPGTARGIARYFRSSSAGGSAHYVIDADETLQTAYDSVIAWHAPPNAHSLGVELCDDPSDPRGLRRWDDPDHAAVLERAALLVAELCLAYGVPARYLGPVRLKLGRRGVTTHAAVSTAFRQSTHWDPGTWPRRRFMRRVRAHIKRLELERAPHGKRRRV